MEDLQTSEPKSKKFNPVSLTAITGVIIIALGIVGIVLAKGVSFVGPMLSEPGPTGTMIQPQQEVSDNLKQPGILGELKAFDIDGSNFKFTPNQIVVNAGDTVQINFTNSQGMHNLTIEGMEIATKTIQKGESEQLTFTAEKKGTYPFYCSVGNHRVMGMEGILVVN